jgi:hypothetical protein
MLRPPLPKATRYMNLQWCRWLRATLRTVCRWLYPARSVVSVWFSECPSPRRRGNVEATAVADLLSRRSVVIHIGSVSLPHSLLVKASISPRQSLCCFVLSRRTSIRRRIRRSERRYLIYYATSSPVLRPNKLFCEHFN